MDDLIQRLQDRLQGLFSEAAPPKRTGKSGYVQVVGTTGIDSNYTMSVECEVLIPPAEYEKYSRFVETQFRPKQERGPKFVNIEQLLYGYLDQATGYPVDGVIGDSQASRILRHNLRQWSPHHSPYHRGILPTMSREDYDALVREWRKKGYSTAEDGSWPSGEPYHEVYNDQCQYCRARMKAAGGTGSPLIPGGFISEDEIRRRASSKDGGWSCGDPVRPKTFDRPAVDELSDFGQQKANLSPVQWLQYQMQEVVNLVLHDYRREILNEVVARLGLDDPETRQLVLGPSKADGFEYVEIIHPKQRYTKTYLGPPPHLQHREYQPPEGVEWGSHTYRCYYAEVKLHLNPRLSLSFQRYKKQLFKLADQPGPWSTRKQRELDAAGQAWENQDNQEGSIEGEYSPHSGFIKRLYDKIASVIGHGGEDVKLQQTEFTYTDPRGREYPVYAIPTGISGLNFLVDPFMPTKSSETKRRIQYYGPKQEVPAVEIQKRNGRVNKYGMHMLDMYAATGNAERHILQDLSMLLEEEFDITLVPWAPDKPFPIGPDGKIFCLKDNYVIHIPRRLEKPCPCSKQPKCKCPPSCKQCGPGEITGCPTSTLIGRILPSSTPGELEIRVNANSCYWCGITAQNLAKKLKIAKAQGSKQDVRLLENQLAQIKQQYSKPHVETVPEEYAVEVEWADFDGQQFEASAAKSTNLGKDSDTYRLWSVPWLVLNMKRLTADKETKVSHPEFPDDADREITAHEAAKMILKSIRRTQKGAWNYIVSVPQQKNQKFANPKMRMKGATQREFSSEKTMKSFLKKNPGAVFIKKERNYKAIQKELGTWRKWILQEFRTFDLRRMARLLKFGEDADGHPVVDISGLTWMDKICIPINGSTESQVMSTNLNEFFGAAVHYDRWLETKKAINLDLFKYVVPQSIWKQHLGEASDQPPILPPVAPSAFYRKIDLDRPTDEDGTVKLKATPAELDLAQAISFDEFDTDENVETPGDLSPEELPSEDPYQIGDEPFSPGSLTDDDEEPEIDLTAPVEFDDDDEDFDL